MNDYEGVDGTGDKPYYILQGNGIDELKELMNAIDPKIRYQRLYKKGDVIFVEKLTKKEYDEIIDRG